MPGGTGDTQKVLPILLTLEAKSPGGARVSLAAVTHAQSLLNKDIANLCTVFTKLNNHLHCIHSPRASLWLVFHLYRNNRKLPF